MILPKVLLCFVLFSSVLVAQTSNGNATDTQTSALVAKSLLALTGGQEIQDVTLTGSARWIAGSTDETGPAILKG
ncbi:MAG: hypothetical protein L0Z53_18965 [Acidobacteriales bacterium]|nr:hypothetical protein [Terriglobales bacterium]